VTEVLKPAAVVATFGSDLAEWTGASKVKAENSVPARTSTGTTTAATSLLMTPTRHAEDDADVHDTQEQ
jgi:hypothetical protein